MKADNSVLNPVEFDGFGKDAGSNVNPTKIGGVKNDVVKRMTV